MSSIKTRLFFCMAVLLGVIQVTEMDTIVVL